MKITIKPEKCYTLILGGEESRGWQEVGRWEGMIKLQREDETIIIDGSIGTTIDSLIADLSGDTPEHQVEVIKASTDIAALILRK